MKLKFSDNLLFATLLILASGLLYAQGTSIPPKVVPLFTLEDLNGQEVSLEDYRGKVVMINFWATYCPPCVEEMPSMQRLLESFSNKPFAILAINMGEDRERVNSFLERIGARFDYALLLDPSMEVAADYKVSALPTTLLVDRQGKHAFGGVGARDWNSAAARQQILVLFED